MTDSNFSQVICILLYILVRFEREGIRMEIICGCRKHYLLLVYRPDMLQEYLKQDEARKLLLQDGYNIDSSLDEMIARLKESIFS